MIDYKTFINEQKEITQLKNKYEGEILAFTRKDNKLKLVAHSMSEDDLLTMIFQVRKNKEIDQKDKIFYE